MTVEFLINVDACVWCVVCNAVLEMQGCSLYRFYCLENGMQVKAVSILLWAI